MHLIAQPKAITTLVCKNNKGITLCCRSNSLLSDSRLVIKGRCFSLLNVLLQEGNKCNARNRQNHENIISIKEEIQILINLI